LSSTLLKSDSGAVASADTSPRARVGAAFAAKLAFENVERRYDETVALQGVSLIVAPAEIVCVLGPSGCGKTTLLRIASGIETPTSGRVLINDIEVAGPDRFEPPERRGVGLMFQDFALFPHLTILENVAFGLRALPREEARREAMAGLARVGLAHTAGEYPHVLSGGQQQRVALARALVPRPSVMLMDEPFSGLDVQLRDTMQEETLTLLRETRATAMIVTHHPEEAVRLGDRIAVMRGGRIVQVGRTEDLYHRPEELYVARLFSEINEAPFIVRGGRIETPLGAFPVSGAADGATAILCIRERSLRLLPAGEGLAGRVLHVKFFGDFALVEVAVEGFDAPLRARVPHTDGWEKGLDIGVEVDRSRLLVFPADATESI
jgi:iron(III) transport system ATP-binding protein